MMDYAVVVTRLSDEDGGGYLARVPDLYGCMSDGETPEEAVTNAKFAIMDWIEVACAAGREIPAVGTAMRRAQAREASLIQTIKILSEQYEGLDDRIARLSGEIEHIKELADNQSAWSRFSKLIDPKSAGTRKLQALPC